MVLGCPLISTILCVCVAREDDTRWPKSNKVGRQELEIIIGNDHKHFETSKFGSYAEVKACEDPDGLTIFWYLIQDIKCFVLSLINAHFRIRPVQ